MNTRILIPLGALLLVGIGLALALGALQTKEPVVAETFNTIPTDFVQVGTLRFDTKNTGQDTPHLEYAMADGATTTVPLVFDPLTSCAAENGATPCIAMSVQYHIPMGDKVALVEGIRQSDGSILARKLRVLPESEHARTPHQPGSIFISWPEAVSLIQTCSVSMLTQSHALDIYLKLKDGRELVAVEPIIDEVFRVEAQARGTCGTIPLATE